MQNKEIEEAKECLKETIQNTYAERKAVKLNNLSEYIEQLETKEQKLIEKLEIRRKQNNDRYGQAIDNDDFPEMYEYNGQVQEDDYILKIVKGDKQ